MSRTPDLGTEPEFRVEVLQNPCLPPGGGQVHAIVNVSSRGPESVDPSVRACEVIIVDTSGSMYGEKIEAAGRAARAAVETLRDGVRFAVIGGSHEARMIYPRDERTVELDASTRAEALEALRGLEADGGTRMGVWLTRAARLFEGVDGIKHAILLTDGRNNEMFDSFEEVLRRFEGAFVCDCRGVGTDWDVEELRRIDSAFLGSGPDIIADPADMAADFRAMTRTSMSKTVADVALRLWTPKNSIVRYVKQVAPTVQDLTERGVERVPMARDYPTGSWGTENRDYHICVEVEPGAPGRRLRAGWVRVVLPGPTPEQDRIPASGNILAEWTADEDRTTGIHTRVAHYTGRVEMARAIQDGLAARRGGDEATATTRLGRAVELAHGAGDEETQRLLGRVVDVLDPSTGTVRLKPGVDKVDEMTLDIDSTRTVRTRPRMNGRVGDGTPGPV
ncbi:vWA domain-containing protein [Nocardiopsis alba]|uniref:von Willebrand factor type A domain protein n=1 Tax=Nocardiopsis alba (strain ATCC BAA-2165 / BE74) TaxID=1205910 RepID=J7LB22_NOCAA|nr:VWA domain-containing protein [Nocardiopsis alba]AFR10863.1 von Willebrand factor type A domain protein [Nocardiopsis alba ATCC BAA-2165]